MTYCATSSSVSNSYLRQFVCPASLDYCPSNEEDIQIKLNETSTEIRREYVWNFPVPTSKAYGFYCKYKIQVSARNLVDSADPASRGYIMLQIEQYGFDEDVIISLQPHGKYLDHLSNANTQNATRMFRSYFG